MKKQVQATFKFLGIHDRDTHLYGGFTKEIPNGAILLVGRGLTRRDYTREGSLDPEFLWTWTLM